MAHTEPSVVDGTEKHKPFVPAEAEIPEFTLFPILVGALLGILFGASSVYLVLKVGMTISASIPVAVISITLFRLFSKMFGVRQATILENNIVQTTGSAGESIAFGVGVTMPALLIMGYEMELSRVITVACLGGLLGVLMMIPLRRGLIVKQHGTLKYPEGTACAEVLIVGEQGGSSAKTVFAGFGLGFVYKACSTLFKFWTDLPEKVLRWYKNTTISGDFSPEMLGVGYIIGPVTSCIMMAGAVLSTLVLVPLIKLIGEGLQEPLYPGTVLISNMDTAMIGKAYVLYIGAGAVAAGGIISLISSFPLMLSSFKEGFKDFSLTGKTGAVTQTPRTERDIPMTYVLGGSVLLIALVMLAPALHVSLLGALMIVVFGFFFVTVSSRLTGEIGSSSNPISGMTVLTLLLTCLIFLMLGMTGPTDRVAALSIAAVVCIAASNGGTTSQDLKTGFLVGATPSSQQIAVLIGALTSGLFIGLTILMLNGSATVYSRPPVPVKSPVPVAGLTETAKVEGPEAAFDSAEYKLLRLNEPTNGLKPGKYLVSPEGDIAWIIDPGINGSISYLDCNHTYTKMGDGGKTVPVADLKDKERLRGPMFKDDQKEYLVYVVEDEKKVGLKEGKYLADESGKLVYAVNPGTKVTKYNSPQARLMSVIIDGILTQKLPWVLVIIGAFIAVILELCRVSSLPFAVGVYLPFYCSVPVFLGGMTRWLVERISAPPKTEQEAETSPGVLLASGLIAGGAICGIFGAFLSANEGLEGFVKAINFSDVTATFLDATSFSLLAFGTLIVLLLLVGAGKLLKPPADSGNTSA